MQLKTDDEGLTSQSIGRRVGGVGCVRRRSPAAAPGADLVEGVLAGGLQVLGRQVGAVVHVELLLVGGEGRRLAALDLLELLLADHLVLAVVELVAAVVHLVDGADRRFVLALVDGHAGAVAGPP